MNTSKTQLIPHRERPIGQYLLAAILIVITLVLVTKAGAGCYKISPGEAAAIQTFGAARPEPESNEGIHWHWPTPIGKVSKIQVRKSRTAEIGFQWLPDNKTNIITGENWQRDYDAATMITGDLSLIEVQMVIHYYITDLNKYLFRADDPGVSFTYMDGEKIKNADTHPIGKPDGKTIRDAGEIALRRSIGQKTIDEAMVSSRETIERETMEHAQDILDDYQTGITITSVQLQEVKPPDEVQAAFDDVLKAREEKEKRINESLAFESRTLPEARGNAAKIREKALAYRAEQINGAEGEAKRFLDILTEYRSDPEIIAKRMHLEMMDRVLPRTNQIIIAGPQVGPLIINATGTNTPVIPIDNTDED